MKIPLIKKRCEGAPSDGQVSLEVNGQQVVVPYSEGNVTITIAQHVRDAIANALGPDVEAGRQVGSYLEDIDKKTDAAIVFVTPGIQATISNPQGSEELDIEDTKGGGLNLGNLKSRFELNRLALGVKDEDPQTIDVVVLDDGALPKVGSMGNTYGIGFSREISFLGLKNTIFLVTSAADADDDYPLAAGHEAGHVFLVTQEGGTGFTGADYEHTLPSTSPLVITQGRLDAKMSAQENLMYQFVAEKETRRPGSDPRSGAKKRLTEAQQQEVRDDVGPGISDSDFVLLFPVEPGASHNDPQPDSAEPEVVKAGEKPRAPTEEATSPGRPADEADQKRLHRRPDRREQ